jgi:hypothetical protein
MSKLMRSKNPRNLYVAVVEIFRLEGSSGNASLLYIDAYRTSLSLSSDSVTAVKRGGDETLILLFFRYGPMIGVSEVVPYALCATNNSMRLVVLP